MVVSEMFKRDRYCEQLPNRLRNDLAEAVLLARWGVVTLQ